MITSGFVLRQYREIYGIKQWIMAARLGFSSAVLCDVEIIDCEVICECCIGLNAQYV